MVGGERIDLPHDSVAWAPCYIGKDCQIGSGVSIGCLAHVGRDVVLGDGVRIQGGAYVADGTAVGKGVFIGPNATILNDRYPPSRDSKSGKWSPFQKVQSSVEGSPYFQESWSGVTLLLQQEHCSQKTSLQTKFGLAILPNSI